MKLFCFQSERDVVTNLDNYMDTIHFSPEINHLMLEHMISGEYEVTMDGVEGVIADVRAFSDEVQRDHMPYYEENELLNYAYEDD